jgi:hypothetical protein
MCIGKDGTWQLPETLLSPGKYWESELEDFASARLAESVPAERSARLGSNEDSAPEISPADPSCELRTTTRRWMRHLLSITASAGTASCQIMARNDAGFLSDCLPVRPPMRPAQAEDRFQGGVAPGQRLRLRHDCLEPVIVSCREHHDSHHRRLA